RSLDEDQLALGRIRRYGLAYVSVIERDLFVSLHRRHVEQVTRSPFAGNNRHAAAEGIDFDSSVFVQLSPLSAGRTLTLASQTSTERARKDWGKIPERLAKHSDGVYD